MGLEFAKKRILLKFTPHCKVDLTLVSATGKKNKKF